MYNEGISVEGGLLDVGIAAGILSKTGAWFNYGDTRLGQGRENARDFLKQNPEIAAKIDDEIRGKVASIEVGSGGHQRGGVGARDVPTRRSRNGAAAPARASPAAAALEIAVRLPRHAPANALGDRASAFDGRRRRRGRSTATSIGWRSSATSTTRLSPAGGASSAIGTRRAASA